MISKSAHVDPSAKIGENVTIHAFAYIDGDVEIGDGCEIMPYASVVAGTRLGKNVKIYQGSIVGADPQDFRWKGDKTYCYIGDNTIIRELVIINRGIYSGSATRIGSGCFVMAESHVGHDTEIADNCVLGNGVAVAGDVKVERGVIVSSKAILHENVHIGRLVFVKAGTRIGSNVPPFVIMAHNPARYYGVNSVVLGKHAGFSDERIDEIAKAYRHIYQSSTSLFNALRRIEADCADTPDRAEILNFVRDCNMHIVGERTDMM